MLPSLFAQGNSRTVANLEALRRQAHADNAARVALRIQAIMLSIDEHSATHIAELLHVHRVTVNSWINAWNVYRAEGLWEGYRSGRPAKLSDAQREQLYDIIESGPVAYGFSSGVWTSPIIRGLILEEFGVAYHAGHVRKLLKELGFSLQRPTTKLAQADPQKQNRWIRYTYPNLKKKPGRKRP
jgi:transposase